MSKKSSRLSVLRAVVQKVFSAKTLDEARELMRKCLESSKVNAKDKQTMLDEIERIKTLGGIYRYIANAILAYEGDKAI